MSDIVLTNADNLAGDPGALVLAGTVPLDQNPAAVYLAGLGNIRVRIVQRDALAIVAGLLGAGRDPFQVQWGALRFQHTAAIRARLIEPIEPRAKPLAVATVNRILSALRGVLKAAWRLGQMSAGDYSRAIDIQNVKGKTVPAGRELTAGELDGLMLACATDPTPAGVRDAAILALAYACGLRRAELAGLEVESYHPEQQYLIVHGKGRKDRQVYPPEGARQAMADWLQLRGSAPGALFVAIDKHGQLASLDPMTPQAFYYLMLRRGSQAGVSKFSPHDMRRTFVSDLLDKGVDIATVAQMAGHASVTTTGRYDRRPEETKRKAASLLHVPYHGRRSPKDLHR